MTTNSFDAIHKQSIAETVEMLKNPQLAIGWALEHIPDQLFGFFTEWKAHEDEYLWAINMAGWAELVTPYEAPDEAA